MNKDIIEALVKIGNHEKVLKICEPNIVEPFQLQDWMVIRTLKALELFNNEFKASKTAKMMKTTLNKGKAPRF